jgi:hypothetical protein
VRWEDESGTGHGIGSGAVTRVHVPVTQEDIDNGVRCDSWDCPVARALWRATGIRFMVWPSGAYSIDRSIPRASLPERVVNALNDFDSRERAVVPFEFDFEYTDNRQPSRKSQPNAAEL